MGKEESKKFNIVMPASLTKSDDGDWKIVGLASTASKDLQGEIVDQNGLDLSPIDMKKGVFNWDHQKGPENTIGAIDSYKKSKEGLYLSGRLFKNHSRAKAVHEIMSSLGKSDQGRMGMSIEGIIKEREGKDGKTIKRAVIHSCALTMNPVNTDTHATLIKSLEGIEFSGDSIEAPKDEPITEAVSEIETAEKMNKSDEPLFSANQVIAILEKALGVGAGYTQAPADLSGGDAMSQSDMKDKKKKKDKKKAEKACEEEDDADNLDVRKSLKKLNYELYKSHMMELLNKLQDLYPDNSRSELWSALKDRLTRKFPEIEY